MGKSLRCLAAVVLAATIPLSAGCGSSNPLGARSGALAADIDYVCACDLKHSRVV